MPVPEWFEDEEFWTATYPFMFPDDRLALGEEQSEKLLKLSGVAGGAALDLGCGPGRHAVALARRGFEVTAVDRTRFLLDKARTRAREAGVEVEFVEQDMRRFRRPRAFDLALSMFTAFGYFDDPAEDLQVLQNVQASLRPGGRLVIDVVGKEWLAARFRLTDSTPGPDGSLLIDRREVVDDWSRIRNEWILIRDGRARSFRAQLRIYSGQELRQLLERAGFSGVRLYGDLDGNPYGREAVRLVALGARAD